MKAKADRSKSIKSFLKLVVAVYFAIFALLLVIWSTSLGIHAYHLWRTATSIQTGIAQLSSNDLVVKIRQAAGDIHAIHDELDPVLPVFNTAQGLPGIGKYLGQVDPLLTYADGMAQAGKEIITGLDPVLEPSTGNQADGSFLEQIAQVLQSGQGNFANASLSLDQVSRARNQIRPALLPASLRNIYVKVDGKFDLITAGLQVLQAAPRILGVEGPQNYLVLAQNRDELRATGGFISGIGRLVVEDGGIEQFDLGDSYSIDDFSKPYPKPPEPLHRLMLADYWVTRDANWSPDFPTSAQEAQALYKLSTGHDTQGVIAFDQLLVKRLLELTGPVTISSTDEQVSAENIEAFMQQAWAPQPGEGLTEEWWQHRKDFMPELGLALIDKVMMFNDQEQLVELGKVIIDLLKQGHLLIYFADPQAQTALEKGGLDGALRPGGSDYLYLVDSNVGFNKADSLIRRAIGYSVDLQDLQHPVGEATLTYNHTGNGSGACKQEITYGNGTYQDLQQRCYLDYWRLYVPGGSELISSSALPVPADQLLSGAGWSGQVESLPGEAGRQIFAGLMMLAQGQSQQIKISYSLPAGVVKSVKPGSYSYSLHIQVQPGLDGLPVELRLRLPNGARLDSPGEGWLQSELNTWTWHGTLDSAASMTLKFSINDP